MSSDERSDLSVAARDRELVERMRAGDEQALTAFTDDYVPGLYGFASRRLDRDRELTREIVQTTVCKAIAKLDSYRGEAPLFTWLCACCRNEIAGHFRRLGARPTEVEIDETAPAVSSEEVVGLPGPERQLLQKESVELVHEALDHLPSRYSQVLEWKYLEGLSVRQIAWRLRVGPKAAESLLTRARAAFRDAYSHLARGWEAPSPSLERAYGRMAGS